MFRFSKPNISFYQSDWEVDVPKGYSNEELSQKFMTSVNYSVRKDNVDEWYRCTVYEIMGNLTESTYTFNLNGITDVANESFLETYDKKEKRTHVNVKLISKIIEKDYIFGINFNDDYTPKVVEIMETDFKDSYRCGNICGVFSTTTLTTEPRKEVWFSSLFSDEAAVEIFSRGSEFNGED